MQLIGIYKDKLWKKKCYEQGLLKILKNYYQNDKNITIHNGLEITSKKKMAIPLFWIGLRISGLV